MKRNILSLAVTAGVAGLVAANAQAAMHINEKGLGETLIYPFFSTEGGNDTYIHVANTSSFSKAVKVRFIDAWNSAEVLDFNLYLSPEDMWTAAITTLPGGGPGIRTVDNSCTVPALGGANPPFDGTTTTLADGRILRDQPFVNFKFLEDAQSRFAGSATIPAEVENTDILVRGTQGYVEVIEMGALDPDTDSGTVGGSATFDYNAAVIHGADGVPANCAGVVAAWTGSGIWTTAPGTDLLDYDMMGSAGGLYGLGQVINITDGTMASYDAIAVDDFVDPVTDFLAGSLHFPPGDNRPDLGNSWDTVTIFDGATAFDYTFALNPYDASSALFMATQIINDYLIDPAVAGLTDWVVTFPTKRPHVNTTTRTQIRNPIEPFQDAWNGDVACEPFSVSSWDREEAFVPPPAEFLFSPRPPANPAGPDPALCKEVNVITFNDGVDTDSSALEGSAAITLGVPVAYNEGWARISFDPAALNGALQPTDVFPGDNLGTGTPREITATSTTSTGAGTFFGLPAVGFAVFKYKDESGTNTSAENAVLNYAASFKHKVVTSVN